MQSSLLVKQDEKHRLEKVLKEEEMELQKAEAELRLAQQAFDQFLQECDRNAIKAQKRAELETEVRMEKTEDIKKIDEGVLSEKREIYILKDQLSELATFESFLYSLSPEAWKQVKIMEKEKKLSNVDSKSNNIGETDDKSKQQQQQQDEEQDLKEGQELEEEENVEAEKGEEKEPEVEEQKEQKEQEDEKEPAQEADQKEEVENAEEEQQQGKNWTDINLQ